MLRVLALWMKALSYRPRDALPDASALAEDPSVEAWVRDEAILASGVVHSFSDELDAAWEYVPRFANTAVDSRGRRAW